jgi:tRNA(fMet)-specific endonuclease VapC
MIRYMLDTNTVSNFLKQHPSITTNVLAKPITSLVISAITEGELQYGLAKRPDAKKLHRIVHEFLLRVDVLPWDRSAAAHYGTLRAEFANRGKTLAPFDMLICAHAKSTESVLVTSDQSFNAVGHVQTEDWAVGKAPSRFEEGN